MIKRDIEALNQPFDVIVVGGGMYGAAMVWEAVSRGYKVALLEKDDFSSNTSANSLKIIHGGLRYLQSLDIKRVLESVRERKIMLKIAPHLVQPLQSVMPTYGLTMKSKHVMWAGMLVNDILSFNRNSGVDSERHLPNCKVISRSEAAAMMPKLTDDHFTGAACWYDGQAYNTERLALAFTSSAAEKGAVTANYVQVTDFIIENDTITGVCAIDRLSGMELKVNAKQVITTAGPWTNTMNELLGDRKPAKFILSKAINLIIKRKINSDTALGITSKIVYEKGVKKERSKRRQLFITPWRDYTVVGTTHLPYDGKPDEYRVSESDIQDFIAELNDIMPEINLSRDDVTFFNGGVLPLAEEPVPGQDVKLLGHYRVLDSEKESGIKGLINVIGVKYTTARDVAEKVMDEVVAKLGKSSKAFSTRETPLSGGIINNVKTFFEQKPEHGLSESVFESLLYNYGTRYSEIVDLLKNDADLAEPVDTDSHVIKAQVIYAVRKESAQKLSDVVLRRTDLGSGEQPSDKALKTCADLMAKELGWDEKRIESEIDETKAVYIPA